MNARPKRTRSGTETRRRTKQIAVRFTREEHAVLLDRAGALGMTAPEYIRDAVATMAEIDTHTQEKA